MSQGSRGVLRPGTVPSVFHWSSAVAASWNQRAAARSRKSPAAETPVLINNEDESVWHRWHAVFFHHITAHEVSFNWNWQQLFVADNPCQLNDVKNNAALLFANLSKDNELLHYYIGLETSEKLHSVFQSLDPAVNCLTYYRTSSAVLIYLINQFIVMLAKLCQDIDYWPLSKMSGISEFNVYNVDVTWVNFCSRQWSEVAIIIIVHIISMFLVNNETKFHWTAFYCIHFAHGQLFRSQWQMISVK